MLFGPITGFALSPAALGPADVEGLLARRGVTNSLQFPAATARSDAFRVWIDDVLEMTV